MKLRFWSGAKAAWQASETRGVRTHGVWTDPEEAAPGLKNFCFPENHFLVVVWREKQPSGFNGHCGKGVPHHVDSSAPGDQEVHARAGEAGNGGGAPAECLRGGEDVRGGGEYTPFPAQPTLLNPVRRFCLPLPNSVKVLWVNRTR